MKRPLALAAVLLLCAIGLAQGEEVNTAQGPRELIELFVTASQEGKDLSPFIEIGADPARDLKLASVLAEELAEKKKVTEKAFLAIPERLEESAYSSPLTTQVPFGLFRSANGQWKITVSPPADPLPEVKILPVSLPKVVQWPMLGLLALAGVALAWLVQLPLKVVLRRLQRREGSRLTPKTTRFLAWGIGLAVASQSLYVALTALPIVGPLHESFFLALRVLTSVGAVFAGWGIWDLLCGLAGERVDARGGPGTKLLVPVMQKFGQAFILIAVFYALLLAFGFNPGGLVAGLGLTTALAALAAKDSVENFFGTLAILFERPFVIGDWVKVGDVEGIVEEIGLRTTKIRSFGDSLISMPNIKVVAQPVENMGKRRMRPYKQTFAVIGGHKDALAFAEAAREWLRAHAHVVTDKSHAALAGLDAGRPQMTLSLFLDVDSYAEELMLKEEIIINLLRIAGESGLKLSAEVPEP